MIASRTSALLIAAVACGALLAPVRAQAQWWSRAPADFEDCADRAEKAATREEKASKLSECSAKFAGRRKPGGGYSYFDFMQNRNFDIAGPNPTPEEQKRIDEQYIVYLEEQRRSTIAAALTARHQQQLLEQAAYKPATERVPVPSERPKLADKASDKIPTTDLRTRTKGANCSKHAFSCEWPRLSEGLQDLKKLFGASQGNVSQAKPKRS